MNLTSVKFWIGIIIMPCVCFFDLATTGFNNPDIIQIGATFWNGFFFNGYVFPEKPISPEASKVTGFTINTARRRLFWNGSKMNTEPREHVLCSFLDFLMEFNEPVILAAHKAHFHASLIVRDMRRYGLLRDFFSVVSGFVDTLEIFKSDFPHRRSSFSLNGLARDFLDRDIFVQPHDALEKAFTLKDLIITVNFQENEISHLIKYTVREILESVKIHENRNSLNFLRNSLSSYMINKLATAGINNHVLNKFYNNYNGEEGIELLLTGQIRNYPKVTMDPEVIYIITEEIRELIYSNTTYRQR